MATKTKQSPILGTTTIPVEVAVFPLWDSQHRLLGYFPAIFGPGISKSTRTYWVPALCSRLIGDPKVYPTPEEAMEAWENGTPWEIADPEDREVSPDKKCPWMSEALRSEINERGLVRS